MIKEKAMKKNKVLIAILVVVLLAACAAVAFLAINGDKVNNETTQSTTQAQSEDAQTTASVAGSVFNTTTTSTTQSTTKDEYAFIRNGAWFLADIDNEECIAIAFDKNGDADVAFFNSDNIEGFDAQYFKGDASYDIRKNKIIFSKLPSATGRANLELEIKENDILYNGKKLRHFDKINLDNALKCFE